MAKALVMMVPTLRLEEAVFTQPLKGVATHNKIT